jgi:hypothetical protein
MDPAADEWSGEQQTGSVGNFGASIEKKRVLG